MFRRSSSKAIFLVLLALVLLLNVVPFVNGQTADAAALKVKLIAATHELNRDALEDPTSYQHAAFERTSQQVNVDSFSDAKIAQYYALYCIYYATYAVPNLISDVDIRFNELGAFPTWTISNNWDKTDVDPCNGWHGIECDGSGKVTAIDLYDNLLTGSWPEEVKLLAHDGPFATGAGSLSRLDLFHNEFLWNGDDSSWITDLGSNMGTIMLEETGFTGDLAPLPEGVENFSAANSMYTGGFNYDTFASAAKLNFLNLDGCMFNTSIPSSLGALPNLEYLYLSDTLVTGTFEPLQGMPAIRELWMDANPSLTGSISPWLVGLTTLESLSLAYNRLRGEIPPEIGALTNLEFLYLYANNFNGTVPSQIGLLSKLKVLQLEDNDLNGWVPSEVCENRSFPKPLTSLGVDCNDEVLCFCCTCCHLENCTESSVELSRSNNWRGLR